MRCTVRRTVLLATLALTTIAWSTPARAQLKDQRNLMEAGLFLGLDFIASKHELLSASLDEHRTFDKVGFEIGARFGYLPLPYVGVEAELSVIPTKAAGESAVGYALRAHVIGQYPVWKGLAPFAVIGFGMLGVASPSDVLGSDVDAAFHWGVGLKYYLLEYLVLRLDLRHIVSDGLENKPANHFAILIGASFVIGWKSDSDGDGIPDNKDKCPKRKGKAPSGCPDTDGDGVTDDVDKCPNVAASTPDGCPADRDKDGLPDEKDKCPDKKGPAPSGCPDTDGDGVTDDVDQCPKVPAKTTNGCPADRDADGVPDAKDQCPDLKGPAPTGCPDADGDGVPDPKDKCPKVPAKTADGCPPDADGDGIPDARDKCPNKPETKNGYLDKDGCPDKIPIKVRRFTGAIRGIKFATGSARIKRRSYRTLRAATKILKQYVGLRIKVRGHTDNRGTADKNMTLSLDRAKAVKKHLVKGGIDAARIQVEGLGQTEPIASNKSRRGRAKNRRIEFRIIK